MSSYDHDFQSQVVVEVTSYSDAPVLVVVRGEVDLATASYLTDKLIDAVDRASRQVVIDAAAMPFLDAAGIAALVAVYQHAATRHIDVRMINVRPLVRRVLHIVELADFFTISAGPDD